MRKLWEEFKMNKSGKDVKKRETQDELKNFSEVNEFNHEENEVAKAQKEMASQETTGVFDAQ